MKIVFDKFLKKRSENSSPFSAAMVVILNIVLLVSAIVLFGRYAAVYNERLQEENLGNIANLNQSAAGSATAFVSNWDIKLADIVQYASRHSLTRDQILAVIEDANSSAERQFELISSDYTGYLARRDANGVFIPVSYQGSAYAELRKVIDNAADAVAGEICFAPEFTDNETALKYFAIYKHLPLDVAGGGQETYTLLLATKSSDVLAVFNNQNDFDGQATVLMDASGNYIVSSRDFKSDNFFQYLYVYNDLTLDQRNQIQQEVAAQGSGELYYKNASGQDCVFHYTQMTTNDWYCITSVPIASFRTPLFSINYAIYAVVALLLLLIVDLVWLRYMNVRLRLSMLREKEASEAKTDFLSRMSHDIRTPLNGIIGLTALAVEEPNSPRTQEYLENVKISGQFLLGLVNDILDMSKVESGKIELKPEPYSSRDLCKYVEAVIAPLCQDKGLEFRMSPPSSEPPVLLDRLRFNQVIFNLLSNAVKYTPEGGLVELFWERRSLPQERVALDITVRDNGIGMSEEFQEHMFDSFTQEHSQTATTGVGLGLAIVHSVVKLMQGQISVASKQGKGTAITVHLEAAVSLEAQNLPESIAGAELGGRRALLCEDNKINILFAQRLLEKWGLLVDTAEDGRKGVDMFSASACGSYDIILMDVMMPEMNGLEATRLIRKMARTDAAAVPIVAMTANAYDTDVQTCLEAGMNAHMGKPIDPEQLKSLMSRLIAERIAASENGE